MDDISPQLQQFEVRRAIKTKDNVLVNVVASVRYRNPPKASDLSNKFTRIEVKFWAYTAIEANVTELNLDEVLQRKNEIAEAAEDKVDKMMSAFGAGEEIVQLLIVDIKPAADEHAGKFWGPPISYQNQTCGEGSSGSAIRADSQWNPISDPSRLVWPTSSYFGSKSAGLWDASSEFFAGNTAVKKPVMVHYRDTPTDEWVPFEKPAFPEFLMNDDDEESGGGGEKDYFLKVDPHFQAWVSTAMQLKKSDDQRRIHLVWNGEWALEFLEDEGYWSFVKEFGYCLLKNSPNADRKRSIMGQSSPKEVLLDPGFLTRRSIDEWVDEAKLLLGLSASACYASPSTFPRVANGLGFAACLVAVSLRHTVGGAAIGILVKFGALGCAAGVLAAMAKDLPQEYILAPIVAFLLIAAVVVRAR